MQPHMYARAHRWWVGPWVRVVLLSVLPVLLGRCSPSGDSSFSTSLDAPSPQVERQAIAALVQLYRAAVGQEDIDRVQALLAPDALSPALQAAQGGATRQAADGTFATLRAFRAHLSATFRTRTVTALDAPEDQIQIASDRHSVTFLEVESGGTKPLCAGKSVR